MIRPAFSGAKNSGAGQRAGHDAHEAVLRLLVALHRPDELLHLGRRRLELREVAGEFVDGQRLLVPGALVVGHRIVERAALGEGLVEGGGHGLGVAEGIRDPERRDRVLVVAGVSHESPSGPVRLAEVTREVSRAHETRLPLRAFDALGELGRELEALEIGALHVLLGGREVGLRRALHHAGEAVVRRYGRPAAAGLGADVGVEAVGGQSAPVRVVGGRQRRHLVVLLGLHGLRQERVPAVRPDYDLGRFGHRVAALGVAPNARHTPVVNQHLLDREGLTHLGSRCGGRLDQQSIEHDAPGAVGLRDPVRRPRRSRDRHGAEVEGVPRDGRAVRRL